MTQITGPKLYLLQSSRELKQPQKKNCKSGMSGGKTAISQKNPSQNQELFSSNETIESVYQRYREMFYYAPDAYLVTDMSGTIREANQTFLLMFSTSMDQIIGKSVSEIFPALSRCSSGIQIGSSVSNRQFEATFKINGEQPLHVAVDVWTQYEAEKRPISLFWSIKDVTRWKEEEKALSENQARLKLLLEKTPCIIWTTDADLNIISLCGSYLDSLNIEPQDLVGINLKQLSQQISDAHQKALSCSNRTFEFNWNGQVFQAIIETLRDSQNKINGFIGAAFDITHRIELEQKSRQSEKFTSGLLEKFPNPILVFQPDTTISYVNPALEKITGICAGTLIGKKAPYPWFLQADSNSQFGEYNLKKILKEEKQFKKKNGRQFWVQITTIPVQNNGETDFYLQTWIDITEAKKSKENMDYFITQISRIQEEERKRISHELHEGILQSLATIALRIDGDLGSGQDDYRKAIRELSFIKSEINGIINEIRKFSHELRPGVLDYLGLPASLETLAEELCNEGINTSFNLSGEEKTLSPEQTIALYRIAQEAVSNIRKYSQASEARIILEYMHSSVRLTISDNGKGFVLPARTGDLGALGKLGIISMSERARLNRGNFSIRSKPDTGTTVQVVLPQSFRTETGGKD